MKYKRNTHRSHRREGRKTFKEDKKQVFMKTGHNNRNSQFTYQKKIYLLKSLYTQLSKTMNHLWSFRQIKKPKPYKELFTFEQRCRKSKSVRNRNVTPFVPALVEGLENLGKCQKPYFTIALGQEITLAFLIEYLRKNMKVNRDQSIFVECGRKIIDLRTSFKELFNMYGEEDGFVYLKVKTQNSY